MAKAETSVWFVPVTMISPQWARLDTLIEAPNLPALLPQHNNVLFVHERWRPDGARRIIVVEASQSGYSGFVPFDVKGEITLTAHVIVPGSPTHEPRMAVGSAAYGQTTTVGLRAGDTILPGVLDLMDPTHFTIPFRRGTTQVPIDGWLMDDDSVKFDPQMIGMR